VCWVWSVESRYKVGVGLGIHIICEGTLSNLICASCMNLNVNETFSVCGASHYGIYAACGNDLKIENMSGNVISYHDVICEQVRPFFYLCIIYNTQVSSRSRLPRFLSFAEINSNASAIQISPLHFVASLHSILRIFIFCEAITSGLFRLSFRIGWATRIRLIDNKTVLKFSMLSKGCPEFVLGKFFVNVANIEASG